VVVARLLLAVVLVRIGTSSASAILRGAGQHRLLAFTNATTAVVNVLLSIVLVKPLGLAGVAIGTLVPITIAAVFIQFPVACARVGVSAWTVCRRAVWPAVWPVIGLIAVVWAGRPFVPPTLTGLGALLVVAGLAYMALYVGCALSGAARRVYWSKLTELIGRRGRVAAAA
jgi:O-antigen/teichoic acid export membrane protein